MLSLLRQFVRRRHGDAPNYWTSSPAPSEKHEIIEVGIASSVQFGTLGVFLQQFRHFRRAANL